jgi:hypothetical protein
MSSRLKMAGDGAESRKKALCVFCRFKFPHFLFSQTCGLMRILRSIVSPFVLPMFYTWHDFAFGRSITPELIGDNYTRNVLQPFEKLAEKAFGSFFVASALHKNVQDIAVLVYGSPQGMSLATDREEDLVQVPFISTTRATTEFIGVRLPERASTIAERFHSSRQLLVARRPLFGITRN